MTEHPLPDARRARSFGAVAAAHAAHRPGFAPAAVDWALARLPAGPATVLDLGAGTGKLTADLVRRPGLAVLAVDPDPAMLDLLRSENPQVRTLTGTAEDIPLGDGAVDAVLVGQAFHWFDPQRAMPEIARVLRPGGVLAGLWNADDLDVDWVSGYHAAAGGGQPVLGVPRGSGAAELPAHPAFAPAEQAEFPHAQRLTVDGLLDVLGTHSWALAAAPDERLAAFARIRAYLATRDELGAEFALPLISTVLRTLRR